MLLSYEAIFSAQLSAPFISIELLLPLVVRNGNYKKVQQRHIGAQITLPHIYSIIVLFMSWGGTANRTVHLTDMTSLTVNYHCYIASYITI